MANYVSGFTGADIDAAVGEGLKIKYIKCSSAADTVNKVINSVSNFTLAEGIKIFVKFTYGNTATNPTLNINSSGAKALKTSDGSAVTS